jgi:hypothetical protein
MAFATKAATQETRAVADLLIATSISAIVTYPQLSVVVGKDIQRHRYLLARGLVLASREAGAVFQNLRGVGYQRLPSAEVHRLGAHARQRIRRTTRRASAAIGVTLEKANLDNDALLKALREMSALDLLRHLAADRVMRRLPVVDEPLSVSKSLAAVVQFVNRGKKLA